MYLLTSDTIHTWFQMITSLEQEALLVIFGIIRDVEHGPEVAVFNLSAFSLARSEVHYIVIVNVYNIVQCDWTSTISKWAKWIWFLSCWNRKYEVWENIYYVEEYVLKIDEENETRTNPKNNQDICEEKKMKVWWFIQVLLLQSYLDFLNPNSKSEALAEINRRNK